MAEAVISRASVAGIKGGISNDTKQVIGLNNSATLDDCIQAIIYKDSEYATITVSVINPDGTPASDAQVRMIDVAGAEYSYNCNAAGKTIFKTNAGKANFVNDEPYADIISETKSVDAAVGTVASITFTRNFHNYSDKVVLPTGNYQFSNRINNFQAYVVGGGGSSSTMYVKNAGIGFRGNGSWWTTAGHTTSNGYNGGNGYANTIFINHVNGTVYQSILGSGGSAPSASDSNSGSVSGNTSSDTAHLYGMTAGIVNGSSGGTSSFGGLISAIGGTGGKDANSCKSASTQNSYGGAAGQGYDYSITGSCSQWSNGLGASASCSLRVYGSSGGAGNVFITNFNYRT